MGVPTRQVNGHLRSPHKTSILRFSAKRSCTIPPKPGTRAQNSPHKTKSRTDKSVQEIMAWSIPNKVPSIITRTNQSSPQPRFHLLRHRPVEHIAPTLGSKSSYPKHPWSAHMQFGAQTAPSRQHQIAAPRLPAVSLRLAQGGKFFVWG